MGSGILWRNQCICKKCKVSTVLILFDVYLMVRLVNKRYIINGWSSIIYSLVWLDVWAIETEVVGNSRIWFSLENDAFWRWQPLQRGHNYE